jgi:hypothetical protein
MPSAALLLNDELRQGQALSGSVVSGSIVPARRGA